MKAFLTVLTLLCFPGFAWSDPGATNPPKHLSKKEIPALALKTMSQPGFQAVYYYAAEWGHFIVATTTPNGLSFAQCDPDDNNHGHLLCRQMTPPGLDVPIKDFLKKTSGFKMISESVLKVLAGGGTLVTQSLSFGLLSEAASGAAALISPQPLNSWAASRRAQETTREAMLYAAYSGQGKNTLMITIPVAASYQDSLSATQKLINSLQRKHLKNSGPGTQAYIEKLDLRKAIGQMNQAGQFQNESYSSAGANGAGANDPSASQVTTSKPSANPAGAANTPPAPPTPSSRAQ